MNFYPITIFCLLALLACRIPAWADDFPIGFWGGPPPEMNTLEAWRTVREANFTLSLHNNKYDVAANRKMLDFCAQLGLKANVTDARITLDMVRQPGWEKVLDQVIADYGKHPAMYGYYLDDEPSYISFDALGQINRYLRKQDPARLPYVNLLPTFGPFGAMTYPDYLDRFLRMVKPAMLSYDSYGMMADGSDRADYFENLELARAAGLRAQVPVWCHLWAMSGLGYRDPTEGEMRWQVYTSLAYGMKGLMYYRYWTLPEWAKRGDVCIVDAQGKPARLYPIVKQLNAEVQALGKTLLGLTSTGVFHTGDIPQGCTRLGQSPVSLPNDIPLVVSFFTDAQGAAYLMLVNRDYKKPVELTAEFMPYVTGVWQVNPATGEEDALKLEPKPFRFHPPVGLYRFVLPPGDGRLLRYATHYTYLEAPKVCDAINFTFDKADDVEGWSATYPGVSGGTFRFTLSSKNRFSILRPYLQIPANRYATIRLRMKLPAGAGPGQLLWATAAEPNFSGTKRVEIPIIADGQFHEYALPVGDNPLWRGQEIRAFRIDPMERTEQDGARGEIDWIKGE